MNLRNIVPAIFMGASLIASPAYAQDANVVSDWLMQNKPWTGCPPEWILQRNGTRKTNPEAFLIDPAQRTATTACIQSGPYQVGRGNAAVSWYLQSIRDLQAACRNSANAGKTCTIDAVRVCTKLPATTSACKTPIGPYKCGACLSSEVPK